MHESNDTESSFLMDSQPRVSLVMLVAGLMRMWLMQLHFQGQPGDVAG